MTNRISPLVSEGKLKPGRFGAFLVAAVAFVAYIGTLQFPFVLDDWLLIVNNPRVQSWHWVPGYFSSQYWSVTPGVPADYYRPIAMLWLRFNYALFGLHPFGWHLTTVLVYVGAAVMVYALTLRVSRSTWVATFAGLVFALHPTHVETGAWVCDSVDSIALVMFTGAFLCWLRYQEKKSTAALAATCVCYFGAMLTKEPAIVFPALVFAYGWIWGIREEPLVKRVWNAVRPALIFSPLSVAYLALRVWVLRGFSHPVDHPSLAQFALTIPWAIAFYLRILFWPVGLSAFYNSRYLDKPDFHRIVVPLIVIVLFCALVLYMLRKLPDPKPAKFGLAWMLSTILPVLYLPAFSASELVHDRYVFMASAGLFLLIGSAVSQVKIGSERLVALPRLRSTITGIVAAVLLLMTVLQQTYWSSDLLLYTRGMQTAPQNALPAMNLGTEFMRRGQYDKAYTILSDLALRLPTNPAVNYNFGLLNYRLRNYPQAELYLSRAAEYDPNLPQAHLVLGMVRVKLGKPVQGANEIIRSIELAPNAKGLHGALSEALEAQLDYKGALREAETEASLSPDDPMLRNRITTLKSALNQSRAIRTK